MKNKLLVKFKDINQTDMNFSIVQGQKLNFLKFKDEKQTFSKVQGPKQYFTFKKKNLWTFVFYKWTGGMYFAFQTQPYVYFFFVFNIWERIKLDWSDLNAQEIYKSSVRARLESLS